MAKSIRSKQRRKMRNVKRQHYAKKDLERLKRLAARPSDMEGVVTMKSAEEIKENKNEPGTSKEEGSVMDVDKPVKVYNKKTMQDEHGHYPEWMNKRAVKRQKEKLAKQKTKKKIGKKIKW